MNPISLAGAIMPAEASGALSSVAISADMLKPLVEGISSNIAVILPVGITIFAIFIGVSVVPKIIKKFTSA